MQVVCASRLEYTGTVCPDLTRLLVDRIAWARCCVILREISPALNHKLRDCSMTIARELDGWGFQAVCVIKRQFYLYSKRLISKFIWRIEMLSKNTVYSLKVDMFCLLSGLLQSRPMVLKSFSFYIVSWIWWFKNSSKSRRL